MQKKYHEHAAAVGKSHLRLPLKQELYYQHYIGKDLCELTSPKGVAKCAKQMGPDGFLKHLQEKLAKESWSSNINWVTDDHRVGQGVGSEDYFKYTASYIGSNATAKTHGEELERFQRHQLYKQYKFLTKCKYDNINPLFTQSFLFSAGDKLVEKTYARATVGLELRDIESSCKDSLPSDAHNKKRFNWFADGENRRRKQFDGEIVHQLYEKNSY